VPVWHERTRELREAGELDLLGVALEQHPDRCALFAQWQGFDWPILWDPFDLSELTVVPVAVGLDEHGIVRAIGLQPDDLEDFLLAEWEQEPPPPARVVPVRRTLVGPPELEATALLTPEAALARLLWLPEVHSRPLTSRDWECCLSGLTRAADRATPERPGVDAFRLGVALRLRHDSPQARPGDFQASLERWAAALAADPTQYIWRRRIQQWGPLLDKPYPFYGWIEEARAAVRARGETPVELRVPLTGSEIAGRESSPTVRGPAPAHPDPEHKLERDGGDWVELELAVAPHTGDRGVADRSSAQVHLVLRPRVARDVHWTNDAGADELWIEGAQALGLGSPRLELPRSADLPATSQELRQVDFTVRRGDHDRIRGTVFYFVCAGSSGECRYLAQDFELQLPAER